VRIASYDEPADLGELPGIGLGSITDGPHAMLHGLFSLRLTERRDEDATPLQYRPGPFLGFSPDEVQDQVDIARNLLEMLGLIIDRPIGAEFADEVEILGRHSGPYGGPADFRELDREMTDPTRSAMDQHSLAGLQMPMVKEPLPRG
jgi:hypothetical protein